MVDQAGAFGKLMLHFVRSSRPRFAVPRCLAAVVTTGLATSAAATVAALLLSASLASAAVGGAALASARSASGVAKASPAAAGALTASGASAAPAPATLTQSDNKPDPDALLINIYKDLANANLQAAQQKADKLVEAYPTFRLGQLIRADILLMHARPITGFGSGSHASNDKLQDLRNEAMVRIKSLRDRPDPDLIPRVLLQLREDQKYALVVDTRQARLYVYQNLNGRIKFMTDYYVSHGRFGINKLREGDQKTPIGVYYITSRLPKAKLPDFYGSGALPINYPNEWDKINGRSGSGIWLHGTPTNNYSRPPLASDGCVVLTNPDLEKLLGSIEIGKTPVIIQEQVDFVNRTRWEAERAMANKLLESWRHDTESKDLSKLLTHYSNRFKSSQGENLNTWFVKSRQMLSDWPDLAVKLKEVTLFHYPGKDNMLVSTFTQDNFSSKNKNTIRKRQYWIKEASGWKIIFEANI
jgi:murein L,D-transpeptidase YafK